MCTYIRLCMHIHTHIYGENPKFVSGLFFSAFPAEVRGFMFVTMSADPKQTFKQATLKFGQVFFFFKLNVTLLA